MKKFLLSCMALAAASFAADAQLYCTGDFEASYWDPETAVEAELIDGVYTFEIANTASLKISTVKGEGEEKWTQFNGGALQVVGQFTEPGTYALENGDANIDLPWTGDWKIVIKGDLSEATFSTTTPKPEGFTKVYLRGVFNGWGYSDETQMTTTDGLEYTFETADMDLIAGLSEPRWKIATDNWSKINFETENPIYVNEDPVEMLFNPADQNQYIDWDGENMQPIKIIFVWNGDKEATIQILTKAGVEAIIADQNVAPVYYNLQGVRVNEPANGLFIKVTGNKVAKVIR